MDEGFKLFPDQASTMAREVDWLFYFALAVGVFFSALIFLLVLYFAVKYRRRSDDEQPKPIFGDVRLEALWTVIPLGLTMVMFGWGTGIFFKVNRPPANAMEINVVAKQWMWKFQHPTGQREINELHVPLGQPIKLTMTSEDVIHSLYVPAFRIKNDVLPSRCTTLWFEATKPGKYHLFCAEYCGTKHSQMGGWIYVMEATQYQQWLAGGAADETPVEKGQRLFTQLGCATCHQANPTARGPSLHGVFGQQVKLKTGQTIVADENYLRESIVNPSVKITAGYEPIMPTFKGLVNEEQLLDLISYLKSIGAAPSKEDKK